MANITKANTDDAIAVIIAQQALGRLNAQNDIIGLITRDWENDIKSYGDTVKIVKRGSLSVNDKAAGSNVTLQAPDTTNVQIVLNKHKEVSFLIEDIARIESRPDLQAGYAQDAADAIREAIGLDLIALFVAHANNVGTYGTNTTAANVRAAKLKMDTNKAPMTGRHLFLSPKDEDSLRGDSTVLNAYSLGENTQVEGRLARYSGFDLHMSQLIVTNTTPNPDETSNFAYHPYGVALATRPLPMDGNGRGVNQVSVSDGNIGLRVTSSYSPNALGMQITLDVLYGVKIVRDEFVCEVRA